MSGAQGEKAQQGQTFPGKRFELAQRPTKCLLTPGTHHYDKIKVVGDISDHSHQYY